MVWNNLLAFFAGGTISAEVDDTKALYERVRARHLLSPCAMDRLHDFVIDIVVDACFTADVVPIGTLSEALGQVVQDLLLADGHIFGFPDIQQFSSLTTSQAVELRTLLKRKERFLSDQEHHIDVCRGKIIQIVVGLLGYLPPTAFKDSWDSEDPDEGLPGTTVALVELLEKPAEFIDRLLVTFYDDDITSTGLFDPIREQMERRVYVASDIPWDERGTSKRKIVRPHMCADRAAAQIAELFLQGTPWLPFFLTPLPFAIPFPARFEHTHIVGGSGHGKTQLLQLQIVRDLLESAADGRSVVVIDSQGDLIRTISHLAMLAPGDPSGLSERVMIIDPNDVEYPVALNMFDADRAGMEGMPLLERERILNATVDLYEYFFGALLGAELTTRQGIIFKYLARLLLEIPDATIHTFRQLMENGEPFRPYMEALPPTARAFFEERFFDRSFNETKKQVLARLWGVLSNATFDRMFSHPRSKVDLFSALQEGRIVLINTAKDLLKDEGASILGRFFIALIAQAALRRAGLPAHERRPCFVYIDEAADYFDDKIGHLLNQARKYKVGMVLAHQNLDQLTPALRASVFSSTSIKYAGGVSGKDAAALGSEMHAEASFLLAQRKQRKTTAFGCYVRNVTPQALGISIPLGAIEALPVMSEEQFGLLRDESRRAYAIALADVPAPEPVVKAKPTPAARARPKTSRAEPVEDIEFVPVAEAPPPAPKTRPRTAKKEIPVPPPLGGGGPEHKYLQNLVREFGQSKGFLAVVEERILEGTGRVDVSLSKDGLKIACEISVTNGRDYELGNIEKCLGAGYAHVLFITTDDRHRKAMEKLATHQLEEPDITKISFCSPDEALAQISSLAGTSVTESTVRGYKVTARQVVLSPEEAAQRRNAVASVIARSLRESKRD